MAIVNMGICLEIIAIFAQNTHTETQTVSTTGAWLGVIGSVVNVGFAALVGWYLLTKALPKMQEDFLNAQEKEREKNLSLQDTQRKEFLTSLEKHHSTFQASVEAYRIWFDARELRGQGEARSALQEVMKHCERESNRRDEMLKVEMTNVNETLKDVREVLEQVRDSLSRLDKHNRE